MLNLSARGDLVEAAANLFSHLRASTPQSGDAIAVMPIPDAGLGEAINDRLRRAAAPRDAVSPAAHRKPGLDARLQPIPDARFRVLSAPARKCQLF